MSGKWKVDIRFKGQVHSLLGKVPAEKRSIAEHFPRELDINTKAKLSVIPTDGFFCKFIPRMNSSNDKHVPKNVKELQHYLESKHVSIYANFSGKGNYMYTFYLVVPSVLDELKCFQRLKKKIGKSAEKMMKSDDRTFIGIISKQMVNGLQEKALKENKRLEESVHRAAAISCTFGDPMLQLELLLDRLTNTSTSIKACGKWIVEHQENCTKLWSTVNRVFSSMSTYQHQMNIVYLINDVLRKLRGEDKIIDPSIRGTEFLISLGEYLPRIVETLSKSKEFKRPLRELTKSWKLWGIECYFATPECSPENGYESNMSVSENEEDTEPKNNGSKEKNDSIKTSDDKMENKTTECSHDTTTTIKKDGYSEHHERLIPPLSFYKYNVEAHEYDLFLKYMRNRWQLDSIRSLKTMCSQMTYEELQVLDVLLDHGYAFGVYKDQFQAYIARVLNQKFTRFLKRCDCISIPIPLLNSKPPPPLPSNAHPSIPSSPPFPTSQQQLKEPSSPSDSSSAGSSSVTTSEASSLSSSLPSSPLRIKDSSFPTSFLENLYHEAFCLAWDLDSYATQTVLTKEVKLIEQTWIKLTGRGGALNPSKYVVATLRNIAGTSGGSEIRKEGETNKFKEIRNFLKDLTQYEDDESSIDYSKNKHDQSIKDTIDNDEDPPEKRQLAKEFYQGGCKLWELDQKAIDYLSCFETNLKSLIRIFKKLGYASLYRNLLNPSSYIMKLIREERNKTNSNGKRDPNRNHWCSPKMLRVINQAVKNNLLRQEQNDDRKRKSEKGKKRKRFQADTSSEEGEEEEEEEEDMEDAMSPIDLEELKARIPKPPPLMYSKCPMDSILFTESNRGGKLAVAPSGIEGAGRGLFNISGKTWPALSVVCIFGKRRISEEMHHDGLNKVARCGELGETFVVVNDTVRSVETFKRLYGRRLISYTGLVDAEGNIGGFPNDRVYQYPEDIYWDASGFYNNTIIVPGCFVRNSEHEIRLDQLYLVTWKDVPDGEEFFLAYGTSYYEEDEMEEKKKPKVRSYTKST